MLVGFGLGIIAAFVWSITNIFDKYLISKYTKDDNLGGIILLSSFFPITLAIVSVFFAPSLFTIPTTEIGILIISGLLMVAWIYFYLKALSMDDTSVVMTILVLAPFFSLIVSGIINNETLTRMQLFGGGLIMLGSLVVSIDPKNFRFKFKLLWYSVLACIVLALMHALFKYLTTQELFWQSMFWRSLGMVIAGSIIYVSIRSYRKSFHNFVNNYLKVGLSLNTTNESLTLIGDSLFAFAILFAPIALVQTTESYQPIFILVITYLLLQFGYTSITEDFSKDKIRLKLVGIGIVLIGSLILNFL
jgi:uncharacterized membrane protein